MTKQIGICLLTIYLSACQAANYLTSDDCDADNDGDFASGECGGNDCNDQSLYQSSQLAEVCGDRIDNNCNGVVDEDCNCTSEREQRPCFVDKDNRPFAVSLPPKQTTCSAGVQQCIHGSWGACLAAQGPTDEICDGKDNDCDGEIDEGFATGKRCAIGVGSCRSDFLTFCTSEETVSACAPKSPSMAFLTISPRNGSWDNDCDGKVEKQCCADGICKPCPPKARCSCSLSEQTVAASEIPACGGSVQLTICPRCECYSTNPKSYTECRAVERPRDISSTVGCR